MALWAAGRPQGLCRLGTEHRSFSGRKWVLKDMRVSARQFPLPPLQSGHFVSPDTDSFPSEIRLLNSYPYWLLGLEPCTPRGMGRGVPGYTHEQHAPGGTGRGVPGYTPEQYSLANGKRLCLLHICGTLCPMAGHPQP